MLHSLMGLLWEVSLSQCVREEETCCLNHMLLGVVKGVVYYSGESLMIFERPNKYTPPFGVPSNPCEQCTALVYPLYEQEL